MSTMEDTEELRAGPRRNRKAQIVRSTETLLRERGLSGLTTRAIAAAVPCSEGAIYVHFEDRLELILAVLHESLPEMLVPLQALEQSVGAGTPEKNLNTAMVGLLKFHNRVAPLLCTLFADSELSQRFRQSLQDRNQGPHRGIASLARYMEQEQQRGRIDAHLDVKTAASVLMSTSFFHAFTSQLLGSTGKLDVKRLIRFVLRTAE
jgi:AcrR family transcriptional regulator